MKNYIISKFLIKKLKLKPSEYGIVVAGEDGKNYSIAEIIKKHIKFVESNINKLEETK